MDGEASVIKQQQEQKGREQDQESQQKSPDTTHQDRLDSSSQVLLSVETAKELKRFQGLANAVIARESSAGVAGDSLSMEDSIVHEKSREEENQKQRKDEHPQGETSESDLEMKEVPEGVEADIESSPERQCMQEQKQAQLQNRQFPSPPPSKKYHAIKKSGSLNAPVLFW